jgi:hypothetical protein
MSARKRGNGDRAIRIIWLAIFLAILAAVVLGLVFAGGCAVCRAHAHSWYPPACCSGDEDHGDCHRVATSKVSEVEGGYRVEGFKDVVPYKQVRPSQDADYHICEGPNYSEWGGSDSPWIRCFFAPVTF